MNHLKYEQDDPKDCVQQILLLLSYLQGDSDKHRNLAASCMTHDVDEIPVLPPMKVGNLK